MKKTTSFQFEIFTEIKKKRVNKNYRGSEEKEMTKKAPS